MGCVAMYQRPALLVTSPNSVFMDKIRHAITKFDLFHLA